MLVNWTPHRFAGGVLALDVANTVVHREQPALRMDRFDDRNEIVRFADAASRMRSEEASGRTLVADGHSAAHVLSLRETTDRLFRDAARRECGLDPSLLPPFLRAAADALETDKDASQTSFTAALAQSALSLLPSDRQRRIRICGNCGWLFLDQSRNRSRLWCDMAVCGNRQKARRHYQRRKEQGDARD